MKQYEAIGLVEVQYFAIAMEVLDEICKVSNVEYITSEKYLGGRLVTLIVGGTVSHVEEAIKAARRIGDMKPNQPLKMALVINKPHEEIMKFIVSAEEKAAKEVVTKEATEETPPKEKAMEITPKKRTSRKVKPKET